MKQWSIQCNHPLLFKTKREKGEQAWGEGRSSDGNLGLVKKLVQEDGSENTSRTLVQILAVSCNALNVDVWVGG